MRILPSIDLKDGKVVRLYKGDFATTHTVADSAEETARRFLDAGATLLHMVDLDGAKTGGGANRRLVRDVIAHTGAAVELGTSRRSARPFMRPAAETERAEMAKRAARKCGA